MEQVTKSYVRENTAAVIVAVRAGRSFEIVDGRSGRLSAVLTAKRPKIGDSLQIVNATQLHHALGALIKTANGGTPVKIVYQDGALIGYLYANDEHTNLD